MKKKILISILSLFGVLTYTSTQAQQIVDYSSMEPTKGKEFQSEWSLMPQQGYTRQEFSDCTVYSLQREPLRADLKMVNITLEYKAIKDGKGTSIYAFNKELGGIKLSENPQSNTIQVQIPEGTYDFQATFSKRPTGTYLLYKENVTVQEGMTLVFDQAECTHQVVIRNFDENNTELTLDIHNGSQVEKGNAKEYRSYTFILLKDYGIMHTMIGGEYRIKGYHQLLHINPVSERISFGHVCSMKTKETNKRYILRYDGVLNQSLELSNNHQDLKLYRQAFAAAPEISDNATRVFGFQIHCAGYGAYAIRAKVFNPSHVLEDGINELYIDLPERPETNFVGMVSPLCGDFRKKNNAGKYEYKFTIGTPVLGNSKEGLKFINFGYDSLGDLLVPIGGGKSMIYPGHPIFTFTDKDTVNFIQGNNTPILALKMKDYDGKSSKVRTFLGRYGEIREAVLQTCKEEHKQEGAFMKHTYTADNIQVDDLRGKNITQLLCQTSGEDITAPAIQMLRFVNGKQQVTDRFGTPADGTLQFSAGDFIYHHDATNREKRYFNCKKTTVEVQYAEHGSENWKALPVQEVPENYRMPGFGYFYQGSLAPVSKLETQWYDLTIILTDESGNKHTQTISPAFKIDKSLTGIAPLQPANESANFRLEEGILEVVNMEHPRINLYALDGTLLLQSVGKQVSTAGLAQGVYIVQAEEGGRTLSGKISITQ